VLLPLIAAVAFGASAPVAPAAYEDHIRAAVESVGDVYAVPPALVRAVIAVESAGRPRAVSRAGARGLMQLMPDTARKTGVPGEELFDPRRNILAGTRLLAVLLRHYEGDLVSALVAYNAGPRRRYAPVPRNGETPAYVARVLSQLARDGPSRAARR
jgi:soluble lytic murein transglycosylase-like protein